MATAVGSGSSISPGASTCAQLSREVVDYIQGGNDTELLAIASRCIDRAVDRINSQTWYKLLSTQDITVVASTQSYDLASDFKDASSAELLDASSNSQRRLLYLPEKVYQDEYEARGSEGFPQVYTIRYGSRQLELCLAPDASFASAYPTIRLHYFKRLSRCTSDSATPGAPPEFDRFLVWDARANLAAIRGEAVLAREARSEADRSFHQLRVDDNNIFSDWD